MKKKLLLLLMFCFSVNAMDSKKKNLDGEVWITLYNEKGKPFKEEYPSIKQQKLDRDLFMKIYDNDAEGVESLIHDGANIDAQYSLLEFSFFELWHRPRAVFYFMYFQASLGAFSSPLHTAVEANNLLIAKALLGAGAYPDVLNSYKQTPLHRAVSLGSVEMIKMLLAHGANPNSLDYGTESPLYKAMPLDEEQSTDIAKLLVTAGADINQLDSCGSIAKDAAAAFSNWNAFYFFQNFDEYTLQFLSDRALKTITNSDSTVTFSRKEFVDCLCKGKTNWLSFIKELNNVPHAISYKDAQSVIMQDLFGDHCSVKMKKRLRKKGFAVSSNELEMCSALHSRLKDGKLGDLLIQ